MSKPDKRLAKQSYIAGSWGILNMKSDENWGEIAREPLHNLRWRLFWQSVVIIVFIGLSLTGAYIVMRTGSIAAVIQCVACTYVAGFLAYQAYILTTYIAKAAKR